jgi:hypothetical protein
LLIGVIIKCVSAHLILHAIIKNKNKYLFFLIVMPSKYTQSYSNFGPQYIISSVDEIQTDKLTANEIKTDNLETGDITGTNPEAPSISQDLNMAGNNITNANFITAQTISAQTYDYISSERHTIKDDEIIVSHGGTNQTKLSTETGALRVDKNVHAEGTDLKLGTGTANERKISAVAGGIEFNSNFGAKGNAFIEGSKLTIHRTKHR